MFVGFHTKDGDYTGLDARLGGRCTVGRVFPDGMPIDVAQYSPTAMKAAILKACFPVKAAGMIPFFSFKFTGEPGTVTSGKADAHLLELKQITQDAHLFPLGVIAAWHHEDDGTDITGPNFVAGYSYVDMKITNPNLRFGPVYEGYIWRRKAFDISFLPPAGKMDFIGLDAYTSDWSGPSLDLSANPEATNIITATSTTRQSVPLFFVERGVSRGSKMKPPLPATNQGDVIRRDHLFIQGLRKAGRQVMGYLYWNSDGAKDGTSVYSLDDGGIAALCQMANVENPLPDPKPVPVIAVTTNGTPYYVGKDIPPDVSAAPVVACGRCWTWVPQVKIEDHANNLHKTS